MTVAAGDPLLQRDRGNEKVARPLRVLEEVGLGYLRSASR